LVSVVVLSSIGCGNKKDKEDKEKAKTGIQGPVRIDYSDCAGPSTRFVSGPRPRSPHAKAPKRHRRATEHHPPHRASPPRDLTKRKVLEEARNAGVLGVLKAQQGDGFGKLTGKTTAGAGKASGFRPYPAPRVRLRPGKVTGNLDEPIIRRYLRNSLGSIRSCYEGELLAKPKLAGEVDASFTISPEGDVVTIKATGMITEVTGCVERIIKHIHFPKPRGGGLIKVRYTFQMFPPGTMITWAGQRPPGVAPSPGVKVRAKHKRYVPGAKSPLKANNSAVAACIREHGSAKQPYGIIVAGKNDDGKIDAWGPDQPEALRRCIAELARKIQLSGRCALAYGDMPASKVVGIDITADSIALGGKTLASTEPLTGEREEYNAIPELFGPLRDRVLAMEKPGPGSSASIRGPLLVRPVADVPIEVVQQVLQTATDAKAAPVLAVQRNGRWKPLREIGKLPVVPVPVGKGDPWAPMRWVGLRSSHYTVPPTLSILVTRKAIWFGVSGTGDREQVAAKGGHFDWKAVDRILTSKKASPRLAGRFDLDIAGEAGVPYSTVAKAIERANAVGFVEWLLVSPRSLSVRFGEPPSPKK
jgi:hypothetical protein